MTANGNRKKLLQGIHRVPSCEMPLTIGEIGGTAKKIISVGAITTKTKVTKYDNSELDQSSNGAVAGGIAFFSSRGYTIDNRVKPLITAPGNVIVAPMTQFNNDTDRVVIWDKSSNQNRYTPLEGTSMATPFVTGVVALMLEANPTLSADTILDILQTTAIADAFTGAVPNFTRGYGKIDAVAAVKRALSAPFVKTIGTPIAAQIRRFQSTFAKNTLTVRVPEGGIYAAALFDLQGKQVVTTSLVKTSSRMNIANLPHCLYVLRIAQNVQQVFSTPVLRYQD